VGWAPHQIEEKKKSVGGQRRMSELNEKEN